MPPFSLPITLRFMKNLSVHLTLPLKLYFGGYGNELQMKVTIQKARNMPVSEEKAVTGIMKKERYK